MPARTAARGHRAARALTKPGPSAARAPQLACPRQVRRRLGAAARRTALADRGVDYSPPVTPQLACPRQVRLDFSGLLPDEHRRALGQFMTPAPVARFMASLFRPAAGPLRVLDPGAGFGALSVALLERWRRGELGAGALKLTAHELDPQLWPALENALAPYSCAGADVRVVGGDFLAHAAEAAARGARPYTHAILNPPYKKIGAASSARQHCRRAGLETVNLYSAFVGLALGLLAPGGQLVALIPRSFANGPYYRPFREFLLTRAALHHVHLFHRRDAAFRDDDVLQENVILYAERAGAQGRVTVTSSTDETFADLRARDAAFTEVIRPGDADAFVHLPTGVEADPLDGAARVDHRLDELGLSVSTGPVVDFRMRAHLLPELVVGAAPLLHPAHLAGRELRWPRPSAKKANAIAQNEHTARWLFPAGCYAVVRRFSSKEERRRVVASVVLPDALPPCEALGFENHLNVFHRDRAGLPPELAWGLFAYLSSSAVDAHLRRYHGHTQVNATDLRALRYPGLRALAALGRWAELTPEADQAALDERVQRLLR